jgi:flavodoxin I
VHQELSRVDAVIIYESMTGTTRRAAHLIADGFFDHRVGSQVYPAGGVTADAVKDADLVVIGTWTDGALVIGQRPGGAKRLHALPDLSGKRCVVYCTYAIHPGRTLHKLTAIVEARGGEVLGGMTLRRDQLDQDARELVARVLDVLDAPPAPAAPPAGTSTGTGSASG